MEQIGIKRNVEGINIASTKAAQKPQQKDTMPLYSTIEWTNKNDGNVYVGKKIKLTQNDKELTGVYVYRKDAKPDEKGNIQGVFMSYDTFIKKMADEVPTINSETAKGYFPNIKDVKNDPRIQPKKPLSLDEIIDQSVKLPDGSVIFKPSICGVEHDIQADNKGNYKLTSQAVRIGSIPTTKKITPKEIMNNKWLCSGTAKKVGDDRYEVRYFADNDSKNGIETKIMTEKEVKDFMKSKHLLTYLKK